MLRSSILITGEWVSVLIDLGVPTDVDGVEWDGFIANSGGGMPYEIYYDGGLEVSSSKPGSPDVWRAESQSLIFTDITTVELRLWHNSSDEEDDLRLDNIKVLLT